MKIIFLWHSYWKIARQKTPKKMKPQLFIALFLFAGLALTAQNDNNNDLKDDFVLMNVFKNIPAGWETYISDKLITIEKKDSVWLLNENWLNNPREDKEIRNKRIIEKGYKTKSAVKIAFEPKWSQEKVSETIKANKSYFNEINLLPSKYKIESLSTIVKEGKSSEIIYVPKTKEDKKRLNDYNNEKESLEKLIRKIPDMNSEKYSLFIIEYKGCIDDMHYVYPNDASVELFTVLNTFRELCSK